MDTYICASISKCIWVLRLSVVDHAGAPLNTRIEQVATLPRLKASARSIATFCCCGLKTCADSLVFVPARAAKLAAGVRRAWGSGLDGVAGIEGALFTGLLDEDEHAFLLNMLVVVQGGLRRRLGRGHRWRRATGGTRF